jgi:hypothetical protein
MPHIPAFEIGGVFLLVAAWIGLAKMREAFPEMLQNVKPFLLVCAGILVVVAGYQTLPDYYRRLFPDKSAPGTAVPPTTPAANNGPQPKKATVTEVEYIIKVPAKPVPEVTVIHENVVPEKPVEQAAPEPVAAPEPPQTASAADSAKPENRGKKIIKSIGHALHFGRHKDDPGKDDQ